MSLISKFDIIIVAECGQGQKKYGVEFGGRYICDKLNIQPNITFEYEKFNDIDSYNSSDDLRNNYQNLSEYLMDNKANKAKMLLIGGDHSLSISSVDAFIQLYKDELSILWIDAHADINDHVTSLTGNIHGMTLGYHHIKRNDTPKWRNNPCKFKSNQLYYFGIRDLDPAEKELIGEENIGYSIKDDDNLRKFIDNSKYLLISFDVDALDPIYMDSTGVMAGNGLNPESIKDIISYSIKQNKLIHLDLMEFNPFIGDPEKSIESIRYILL